MILKQVKTSDFWRAVMPFTRALQNTGGALSYTVRWENWYATGNVGHKRLRGSFAVTRSDSESIFQQQFGEDHGYEGCYSIYFDSSTIIRLSGSLQKVSNDDTWACWCIILRKRAGIDNMDYHMFQRKFTWMLREAGGGLKATAGNRVKPDYHFIRIVLCSFLFLSARLLSSLADLAQKHVVSTYWTLWA